MNNFPLHYYIHNTDTVVKKKKSVHRDGYIKTKGERKKVRISTLKVVEGHYLLYYMPIILIPNSIMKSPVSI